MFRIFLTVAPSFISFRPYIDVLSRYWLCAGDSALASFWANPSAPSLPLVAISNPADCCTARSSSVGVTLHSAASSWIHHFSLVTWDGRISGSRFTVAAAPHSCLPLLLPHPTPTVAINLRLLAAVATSLRGNTIFSSLDLFSGYWQVYLAPEARAIIAFSTPSGHFEWLRMPFGLKSAPITFQRLMNTLLGDLLGKDVFAYLDDLIICSKDADNHFASLESVLDKLRTVGLKLELFKCVFLKAKVSFLGYMVDSSDIHTQADKIEAIKNFPQPRSVENVRSFQELCGYYRSFICGFSKIASPLSQLTKKGVLFHWDAPQQNSFDALKTALTNAHVPQFPNYAEPLTMFTDTSTLRLGAVLMQPDQRGKLHAIAYASQTLNQAEKITVSHILRPWPWCGR